MRRPVRSCALVLALVLVGMGCAEGGEPDAPEPSPTDAPTEPPRDADEALRTLGQHLFYDPALSLRGNVSCASCHDQARAFSDGRALSEGTTGEHTGRNAQALANVAYAATLTWLNPVLVDLAQQARVPLFGESPIEHGMSGQEGPMLARLAAEPRYRALFEAAFPAQASPYQVSSVLAALARFERSLVSLDAPYDRYLAGDVDALEPLAREGLALFESARLGCRQCHAGRLFSSAMSLPEEGAPTPRFENNGLYATYQVPNRGLFELTGDPADMGKFRPPSLRNVELTAPYMHDGSLSTLDAVLDHYARGGWASATRSPLITGFVLTSDERAALLAFLRSLTDPSFLTDPRFANPWR